jgi:oligosaccharide repeat unit polymerase
MTFTRTSIIFFVVALAWFFRGVRKPSWDPFAPVRLFGALWFAAISITTLYWSELQMQWTFWSWFCILGSMGCFMAGATVAGLGKPQGTQSLGVPIRAELDPKRFVKAVSLLYLVCLAAYLWRVAVAGGIPAFATNLEEARWVFFDIEHGSVLDRITGNIAFLFSAVVISCSLFFFVMEGRLGSRKVRMTIGLLLFSALGWLLLTAFRGTVLTSLIIVCVLYHYVRRKFRVWTLVGVTLSIMLLGLVLVVYRHLSSPGFSLEFTFSLAYIKLPPEYAALADPYGTIALSMDNIVQLLEKGHTWTLGALTFAPIWNLLGLKGMFMEGVTLPFLPAYGFNTATYLYPFYEDFGTLGVFLFPFLFGAVAGTTYRGMLTQKKLSHTVAYSFVVVLILISAMNNIFVVIQFWIQLGSVYAVMRYSGREAAALLPPRLLSSTSKRSLWSASNAHSN